MLTIITFLCIATSIPTDVPTDVPTEPTPIKFTEMIMVEETSVPKPTITATNEKRK